MVKNIKKIVSRGLHDILTQKLNDNFTGYSGDAVKWQGHSSFVFTPTQTKTELPSGDDPAWEVIKGAVVGDVELKLYGIPLDAMPELLGVKYSAVDGVCVGDNEDDEVWLGMAITKLVKSDGEESRNKTILYKVHFDLPEINDKTISKDDNAVAELTLKGQAYPVFYTKANGNDGRRTYCIVNSKLNKTKYDANAESIVFPAEFVPDVEPNTNSEEENGD